MTTGIKSRGATNYLARDPETNSNIRILVSAGRQRDTLEILIRSGATGCNFSAYAAARWAAYVHRLRVQGFDILTIREAHGGAYPGRHARYFLRSIVTRELDKVPA